jgi:hypothetical protein
MNSHWIVPYNLFCVDQKSKMASNTQGRVQIIGTRLTMFGRRIVEFLHKRTCRIFLFSLTIGLYWNSKKTKKLP